jgi:hypothetical protein
MVREVRLFATGLSGREDASESLMIRMSMLVWALALLVPAQATTLRRASLDDLIQTSTAIVHGSVVKSYTASRGLLTYTHYTVQVLDRWKGPASAQVDVQVPCCNISGAPQFSAGAEYVFFLWTGPSGANYLLGLSQGALDVTTDASGNVIVVRQSSEALVLNPVTGAETTQDPMQMKLSDFAGRVTSALKGGNSAK